MRAVLKCERKDFTFSLPWGHYQADIPGGWRQAFPFIFCFLKYTATTPPPQ